MSKKASKDALIIAASNLTIAEAIFGMPGGATDHEGTENPPQDTFDSFKAHLKRLEDENQ
jgi:hypothetical protein